MRSFHLIELCCGSAALTMHLLGATRQIVPYQGSKWKVRRELAGLLHRMGHTDLQQITLNDIGPWGRTWKSLCHPMGLAIIKAKLEHYASRDPREVYDELQGQPLEGSCAAEHLFLQRLSFRGKAVGTVTVDGDEHWKSPGFNPDSAYGSNRENFGKIKPLVPSLIRVLGKVQDLKWPRTTVSQLDAGDVRVRRSAIPLVVYIDPPYVGTTAYPNGGLDRAAVVDLAVSWAQRGATVIVSEQESVYQLFDHGFGSVMLKAPSSDGKLFQTKGAEVATFFCADNVR